MEMHNPPHPGEVLKELYLEPLELTVAAAARALGVSRKHLSQIVHGHKNVAPEMALRLATAFSTTPALWLNLQSNYDIWQVRQRADLSEVEVLFSEEAEPAQP